jgi:peptide/nickel transport system substrate-binding protein
MSSSYWTKVLSRRITRRRGLIASSAALGGAAFLAACGDDDDDAGSTGSTSSSSSGTSSGSSASSGSSSSASTSGLLAEPVDTSKQAVRGGVSKWYVIAEPPGFDVHVGGAPKNPPVNLTIGTLVSDKPGHLEPLDYSEYSPDIAESWEWAPDGLSITFKIRQGVKWHNKPPVNGRAFDMDDVRVSWERFSEKGRDRGAVANSANPDAPVLSFEQSGPDTMLMKLKEPTSYLLALVAPRTVGKLFIIPKESDDTFDPKTDLIGTGPYVMTEYVSASRMAFERNPDFYDKEFSFVDKIEAPILLEYAQRLAQFRAGNIYTLDDTIRQEDVLPMKNDLSDILVFSNEPDEFSGGAVNFGFETGSVFHDERVRQAMSMSLDRELVINVLNNVDNLEAAGLPVDTYWASSLPPGAGSWRLDPRDDKFGDSGKYYAYNVEDAKKLLAAAGYPDALDVTSRYVSGPQLGDVYTREQQLIDEMVKDAGFRVTSVPIDYVTEYPNYRDANGRFDGWAHVSGAITANDGLGMLVWRYSKAGGAGYLGFDAAGTGDSSGDPQVDSMLGEAQREFDVDKRKSLVWDIQRYLGEKQYNVVKPGSSTIFTVAWPGLANFNVYRGDRRSGNYTWWLDQTKAPFA